MDDQKPAATNRVEAATSADTAAPTCVPVLVQGDASVNQGDLPFLVTQWLAKYGGEQKEGEMTDPKQQQALDTIRRATTDIASAFSSLGAFGTTYRVSYRLHVQKNETKVSRFGALPFHFALGAHILLISGPFQPSFSASFSRQSLPQNSTYSDVSRQWSGIPSSHLDNLVGAVVATNTIADATAQKATPANLLHAAGETLERKQSHDGRTLQDAILVDESKEDEEIRTVSSALQAPVLFQTRATDNKESLSGNAKQSYAEQLSNPLPLLHAHSAYSEIGGKTAQSMRQFLSMREMTRSEEDEMRSLQVSIQKQQASLQSLNSERARLLGTNGESDHVKKLERLDEIKEGSQNCDRVIAQLNRKLTEVESSYRVHIQELQRLGTEARFCYQKAKKVAQSYRDPFGAIDAPHATGSRIGGNPVLRDILARQQGFGKIRIRNIPMRPFNRAQNPADTTKTRKTLFCSRLSHAATFSTHLNYPVYCLRFDRTGRYFITGADDYLIKVFYLGADQSCSVKKAANAGRELKCNYGANSRGAVLVCSLRGHAGVINDIDVSSDNCFLATASVDGDCRIWGLKDGCPIAILRGHKGGANMVRALLASSQFMFG
jgi:hypothetical protein